MSIHRKTVFVLILSILFSGPLFVTRDAQAAVGKWEVFELTLTTSNSYSNPYTQVTLTATFTAPSSNTIVMPGFWDGGDTWKVRMAPNEIGTWTYVTASNDGQLDNQSGQFGCIASSRKGFIKVDPSDPYKFRYDDGTPFFWMGDTSWHLFNNNIIYDGDFKDFIDRRAAQHFTNIHAGLYCGSVYENEGGKPFPGAPDDMDNLNPDYFRYVDRKVDYITSKGMVMGLFLTWAQQFVDFTTTQFERYERYVVARYAAYNVYWVVSGEYNEAGDSADYAYHGNKIDEFDPYDHPISIHTTTTNNEFGNDSWLTYIMHQKFEQDSSIMLDQLLNQLGRTDVTIVNNVPTSIADGNHLYNEIQIDRIFDKPVVNAEFGYEQYDGWTGRTNRTTPDTVRRLAWNMVMAGGFITYGMEATYKAFDGAGPFSWKLPAQELGGGDYMKLLYEFMIGTKWWEMGPDSSVIKSGAAVALVNPGTEYVVYLRSGTSVTVDLSAVSGDLTVQWFDTKDGDRVNQGTVSGGGERVFTEPGGIDGEGVLRLYGPVDLVISGLGSYPLSGGWAETFAEGYSHGDWVRVNWAAYNSVNGEARVATGDVDGDGKDEIVLGLGSVDGNPAIPGGWFELLDDDFSHLAWGRINWATYNGANGESWPACGDVDGDGRDEIIVGLGSGGGKGWVEVFDYDAGSITHTAWARVNWWVYNTADGETRPACGDIDGDGRDEVVVGLGSAGGGWFKVFDDALAGYAHLAWPRVQWATYNGANGESWPACGDVDGDGRDEVIVGLGTYPAAGGWFEVFDYDGGALAHTAWARVNWWVYNTADGETRPACGDVDRDGRDEVIIGFGSAGRGWFEVFDDALGGYAHVAWPRVQWSLYNSANGETRPAVKE